MILDIVVPIYRYQGYIAGTNDGIVTVRGKPASREVVLFDAKTLSIVRSAVSLSSGRYLLSGLNPVGEYLVMVRDYKKEYEPFVWDYVKPADDLTIAEQQDLWQTWQ